MKMNFSRGDTLIVCVIVCIFVASVAYPGMGEVLSALIQDFIDSWVVVLFKPIYHGLARDYKIFQ